MCALERLWKVFRDKLMHCWFFFFFFSMGFVDDEKPRTPLSHLCSDALAVLFHTFAVACH